MISVMFGSARSASSGPSPRTSSRTESTRRSLSVLVIVIAVVRKYSSASSRIFSRTPTLLLESIWSANRSISLAWIWTLAAVNAGGASPTCGALAAAAADNDAGGAVSGTRAFGTADDVLYELAPPGAVAAAGPLLAGPDTGGAPVWFCLTLSSRPIFSCRRGRYRLVKWNLASTSDWLTPLAASTVGQVASGP